ncbi:MAG: hypothetical protein KatS3mg057_2675 [Herpetosiphonaceae bacterium]|nr:MAG: hypothetical protein KatS3mg057_2675 [Herpetosiphonaceae bacterium]
MLLKLRDERQEASRGQSFRSSLLWLSTCSICAWRIGILMLVAATLLLLQQTSAHPVQSPFTASWVADYGEYTQSLAWGDVDSDGDLDLAVATACRAWYNTCPPDRIYRNDAGILTTTPVWSSAQISSTTSLAWGDYDSDGDLDLAVGNGCNGVHAGCGWSPNRFRNLLYRNDTPIGLGATAPVTPILTLGLDLGRRGEHVESGLGRHGRRWRPRPGRRQLWTAKPALPQ